MDLLNFDYDDFTAEKLKSYCQKYISFLRTELGELDSKLFNLYVEDEDLEEEFEELKACVEHLLYYTQLEMFYNLDFLMDYYDIQITLGSHKRFKFINKEEVIEVDTFKEMLDWILDIIKFQALEEEINAFKKYGLVLPASFGNISTVTFRDLYNFIKDKKDYILCNNIGVLYIFSEYLGISILRDEKKMQSIFENLSMYEQLKKEHQNKMSFTKFDLMTDYLMPSKALQKSN